MLDLLGRGYLVECCASAFAREMEEKRYRAYVTDALMAIAENTARLAGGRKMAGRWIQTDASRDARGGDEIVRDAVRGAGLRYAGNEMTGGGVVGDATDAAGGGAGAGFRRV